MADHTFTREFRSPRTPYEVFDEIDDHLVEKLGGKVHYSKARRKYVVQGPSKGIKMGPLMNLKIFFDLRYDNQETYRMKVKIERKPSPLLWALIPLGILLSFSGVPMFWLPLMYFFANPNRDIEEVVDSFIRKMKVPEPVPTPPRREVYQAIIVEKEPDPAYERMKEGKVQMAGRLKRLLVLSLLMTLLGLLVMVVGVNNMTTGGFLGMEIVLMGMLLLLTGGAVVIVVLVRMATRDY
jgi:hypothetical protein